MKKILVVLSEYGYWGEELIGPLEVLDNAGYEFVFITPNGKRARALPPSMDTSYIDPPLGIPVVSAEMAEKVKNIEASDRLEHPVSLASIFPERPYFCSKNYAAELDEYNRQRKVAGKQMEEYAALLLVGGSGPIVDMVNNQRVHDCVLAFYRMDRPIAAECYGVACLAFARDWKERKCIIRGKHVTGHPLEHDYKDGTGFLGVDFNMGPPPYPLEYILRDAAGPDGGFHSNLDKETSVIVDWPFITCRSTASSYLCGEKLIECLEKGLRRFGW